MDYKQLAVAIIENIGGKSNVKSVVHCFVQTFVLH